MADFDPDAYLASVPAPPKAGFDPDAYLASKPSTGLASYVPAAISDIPGEIAKQFNAGVEGMNSANPWSEQRRTAQARGEAPDMFTVPRAIAGGMQAGFSIPTGIARSLIGHPLAAAVHGAGTVLNPTVAAKDNPQEMYENAANAVESALPAMAPARGGMRAPVPAGPAPKPPGDMLDVMLSEGQRTGDLTTIRREQAALRGQLGTGAEEQAKAFQAQQAGQVQTAAERIQQGFDPFGQTVAETPHEAGALVSQAVQSEAARAKAGVTAAYDAAKALPGEIEAGAFDGIGTRIKIALSSRPEPVVIDDKLTPFASRAIQDVDDRIAQLQIQNRASPAGQPPRNQIAGVTLEGVDQMRKRLSAFRKDAFSSGNAADGRAARAVLDAFDDHIDQAIKSGQFTGDQRAIDAWNDARGAHADYRSTFTAQKNDPIGRVVERITGKGNNPAAIPNDVADFLYGSSGVNPNTLNVGVANRVKSILGDQSPEWSAVKQGLFSRLTESSPGMTDFGPAKIAQRLNRFLSGDGRELAETIYSPAERQMIQQFADLHRKLEVPKTGANWSETSTFLAPILRKIGSKIGMAIGGAAGHFLMPGMPWGVSEAAGAGLAKGIGMIGNAMDARKIAKQMPLIDQAMQAYQKALAAHNKANAPLSNKTLAVAATNLTNALAPLGIDLRKLNAVQGPAPASADQNQRQRGGRTDAEPDQGEGEKPNGFAHGGRTEAHAGVKFKDGSEIGLAVNPKGVHFQCRNCKYNPAPGGICRNKDPELYGRKIKPAWCCNLFDRDGMRIIV